jgi:hypothetical protein
MIAEDTGDEIPEYRASYEAPVDDELHQPCKTHRAIIEYQVICYMHRTFCTRMKVLLDVEPAPWSGASDGNTPNTDCT